MDSLDPALAEKPGSEDEHRPSPADTPSVRRRSTLRWVIGIGIGTLIVATVSGVHLWANQSFDEAAATLRSAAADAAELRDDLQLEVQAETGTLASAEAIVSSAADQLVDVAARDAFAKDAAATAVIVEQAEAALERRVLIPGAKPLWTWELLGSVPAFETATATAESFVDASTAAQRALEDADAKLAESAVVLFGSAAARAAALESANVSARTIVVLDFRDAAAAVVASKTVGTGAAVAMSVYAQRASVLDGSARSELAEKAGHLFETRLEIEAYARSISGGVVLDFDWADVVAGVGGRDGMGGTATWNTPRGGFSTITLSHSVAENWPSADARALVAHEVGHSITSKCHDKFDSESADANEEWATAWAISMGHTAEGNGVQAYGYPSQSMIDLAATCR